VSSSTFRTHLGRIPIHPRLRAFSPSTDNVLLSHADRRRVVSPENRRRLAGVEGSVHGSFLHDGFLCGVWRVERNREGVVLVISRLERLTKQATAAIVVEGRRLLRFLASDADAHEVRVVGID